MTKVQLHMMLVLYNMIIEPLNVRKKKKKRTTEYDKNTVICNVDIAQCEDGTIYMMLVLHNERIIPSNMRKK